MKHLIFGRETVQSNSWPLVHKPEMVIKRLEQDLEQYDVLFLFNDTTQEMARLLNAFLESQALAREKKKILVLAVNREQNISRSQQHCTVRRVAEEDYKILRNLYRMYEFSDRLRVMETEGQYGGLENYVRLGILTREEMFEALLH